MKTFNPISLVEILNVKVILIFKFVNTEKRITSNIFCRSNFITQHLGLFAGITGFDFKKLLMAS